MGVYYTLSSGRLHASSCTHPSPHCSGVFGIRPPIQTFMGAQLRKRGRRLLSAVSKRRLRSPICRTTVAATSDVSIFAGHCCTLLVVSRVSPQHHCITNNGKLCFCQFLTFLPKQKFPQGNCCLGVHPFFLFPSTISFSHVYICGRIFSLVFFGEKWATILPQRPVPSPSMRRR